MRRVEDICGERKSYHRASLRTRRRFGRAAMRPHNRIHESQPQPMPMRLLSSDKTFKRSGADVRRKSWTIVFDHQFADPSRDRSRIVIWHPAGK